MLKEYMIKGLALDSEYLKNLDIVKILYLI